MTHPHQSVGWQLYFPSEQDFQKKLQSVALCLSPESNSTATSPPSSPPSSQCTAPSMTHEPMECIQHGVCNTPSNDFSDNLDLASLPSFPGLDMNEEDTPITNRNHGGNIQEQNRALDIWKHHMPEFDSFLDLVGL